MLDISILVSDKTFDKPILEAIKNDLNKVLSKINNQVEKRVKENLFLAISIQPEWQSLKSGKLRADFGIPDGLDIDSLLKIWSEEFEIKINKCRVFGKEIKGSVIVSLINGSYSNALASPVAEIQSKNGKVFWLEWLLLAGNSVVVSDYSVIYNLSAIQKQYSRTGEALMKFRQGDSFKVDAVFAGTTNDNFITRALSDIKENIIKIIYDEIDKNI